MKIALVSLRDLDLTSIISDIKPELVLISDQPTMDKRLADVAIQLDELIHFHNQQIDLVCVINNTAINIDSLNADAVSDYVDRVYYTTRNLHTSSFYCKPHVFSLISNLYKIDFNQYSFKQLEYDTAELLAEKIFYIVNRLGIEIKIE